MVTERVKETALAIRAILFLVAPFWNALFAVGFAFIDAWLVTLIHKFEAAARITDRGFAIFLLVICILYTITYGSKALVSFGRCVTCRPKTPEELATSYEAPILLRIAMAGSVILLVVAVDILLAVRIWTWFVQFRSAGETRDSNYCVVLGVMTLMGALRGLLIAACTIVLGSRSGNNRGQSQASTAV